MNKKKFRVLLLICQSIIVCLFCSLKAVSRLVDIQRTHEDYRPHVCEECARSFKVKRHLDAHMRTHTGEKSFQCRHCDKRFAKEWTRTQHERLHLGVKPYACHVCDARYSQKTSLDCHIRTHHTRHIQTRTHYRKSVLDKFLTKNGRE